MPDGLLKVTGFLPENSESIPTVLMSNRNQHFYEFGPFRLDPLERRLQRDGNVLTLTPKAFDVLLLLVVNGGHVLRKDEFLEKIWAGSYVEEKNLADNISLLRKVLGDDVKAPSFIQTVPRLGYRFVADVREVTDESEALFERTRTHIVIEEETRDTPVAASTPIETYATTQARGEASAKPRVTLAQTMARPARSICDRADLDWWRGDLKGIIPSHAAKRRSSDHDLARYDSHTSD